jgi:cardiolipin synthase (CMP-forming)
MLASLPNLLSIGRILLVPVTVWALLDGDYNLAFLVFIVAGLTDGIDGYIARRFNVRSELGAYLDPLADKALLVAIYVTLAFLLKLPLWLVIIVVTRDILIVAGVLLSRFVGRPLAVNPHIISKANTVAQIILAAGAISALAFGFHDDEVILWASGVVAVLTVASFGVYMRLWLAHMAAHTTEPPQ